jgi:hypothetical protein
VAVRGWFGEKLVFSRVFLKLVSGREDFRTSWRLQRRDVSETPSREYGADHFAIVQLNRLNGDPVAIVHIWLPGRLCRRNHGHVLMLRRQQ